MNYGPPGLKQFFVPIVCIVILFAVGMWMLFYGLVSHESVYIEKIRYSGRQVCNPAIKAGSCRKIKLKLAYINGEEISAALRLTINFVEYIFYHRITQTEKHLHTTTMGHNI